MSALPEKNRPASDIGAGYEIEVSPDSWVRVVSARPASSPLPRVSFELANGYKFAAYPEIPLRSRRLGEAAT